MSGYNAVLKDGQELYVPTWPASVAVENLTKAGEFIGSENLVRIAELNIPSVMVAIMNSKDAEQTAALIKHFVCTARIDSKKIYKNEYDSLFEGDLALAIEIFAHVVKAVYADFFESGLAKANSPEQ